MALGDTNINTAAVRNEISAASNKVGILVGASGLNIYSRYSPGTLGVDASKNIILTPPTSNFKLGDYRRYNHSAVPPTWWISGTRYWGPGGSEADNVYIQIAMEQLNIAAIPNVGIDFTTTPAHYHVRVDIYDTDAARTTGTSPIKSIYPLGVDMVAHTPLVGHTRQVYWVMNTGYSDNQFILNDVPVDSGNCTRYMDAYFCDISGNKTAHFGASRSMGYVDVDFHENEYPVLYGGYNFGSMGQSNPDPISGVSWTFAAPFINDDTVVCNYEANIQQTLSSADIDFYVKVMGICATPNPTSWWVAGVTSCDIILDYGPNGNDYTQTLATGVAITANSAGYHISTTLSGGRTWQYNWTGRIRLANTIFSGTNYNCS